MQTKIRTRKTAIPSPRDAERAWQREVLKYLGERADDSSIDPPVPDRPRVCSAYWAEQAASQGPGVYAPRRECHCANCRGARPLPGRLHGLWPDSTVVCVTDDRDGRTRRVLMSSECCVELLAPAEREKPKVSENEAAEAGLRRTSRKRAQQLMTLVSGCESCGGLRARRSRYCLACNVKISVELYKAGWDARAIRDWCGGKEMENINFTAQAE